MKYLVLALLCVCFTVQGRDFFVAPGGRDTNPGSSLLPFATLQHAVEATRAESTRSNRVLLCQGEYYDVSLELTPGDSGLTLCAAPGEQPVLYGGKLLSNFQPEGGPFVVADLPAHSPLEFRMLLVNNHWAPRARFPQTGRLTHLTEWNVSWMGTYGGGWQRKPTTLDLTTMRVRPGDLGPHFEPSNAELTIFHQWDESLVAVKSYDSTTGEMTFSTPTGHPPGAFGRRTYVVWNTRDGMIRPGQWYLDRARRKVIYWPLPGENIREIGAVIPTTTAVIRLTGRASEPVHNVTIEGVTFAVANTPLKTGGFGAYAFDGLITGQHLRYCRFLANTFRHTAGQGLKLTSARNCLMAENEIYETGAGGILCQDSQNLQINRNHIHDVGRIYPSALGITCTGDTNGLSGNFIHDTPYVGLTCDGLSALIESNRLQRVMQELQDGAAIYLGGTNHLIRYNHCRDIGGASGRHAYYMDELVRDSRLEYNLAVGCASPLHNHLASNNIIADNIFINDGPLSLAFYRCEGHSLKRNLLVAKGRIDVFRPEAVSVWTNNLFYSESGEVMGHPVKEYIPEPASSLRVTGVQLSPDPHLTEVKEGLVQWAENSSATRLGIKFLDLQACGQDVGPQPRKRMAQAAHFPWAKEALPEWVTPFVGKEGFRETWRNQPGPLGGPTLGIDLWQANHFVVYRKETHDYLYRYYTPLKVNYQSNSLPHYEALAARYTAGLTSNREKALALLTKAMPAALRHPSIPPCSRAIPPDRALLDESLLATGAAWCNEQARAFVRLCQVSGIPARIVFLFYSDYPHGHVVAEFYADGQWSMADSSWLCVFPDKSGRLLSAAEIHTTQNGLHSANAAYRTRITELLKLTDEELNTLSGAGTRRFLLQELKSPAKLDTFGLINYPLPEP